MMASPAEVHQHSKPLSLRFQVSERDFVSMGAHEPRLDIPRPWTSTSDTSPRGSVSTLSSIQTSFSKLTSDSIFSRRPSVGSQTSAITLDSYYEHAPTLVRTPWEAERGRNPKHWSGRPRRPLPARYFERMPREIYECVLRQVEALHLGGSGACGACYTRDLYNLALTSNGWYKVTRDHMYRKLWVSADSGNASKKQRLSSPAEKLRLLLGTLRRAPQVARIVKELRVSDWLQVYEFAGYDERNDIVETLSAIVMTCTNLERLTGFYTVYNHELDALTQALSSRTRLKERLWIIRDDRAITSSRQTGEFSDEYEHNKPPRLDYANAFMNRHVNWASLETLVMFGHDGLTGMDYRAFVGTFRKLQCLKRLSVATFPAEEFDDRTLQAIPGVSSLRLQSLPGVTDKGLGRWVSSESATQVRSLTLIDLEITSLQVIAKTFNNMVRLVKFTFSQDASPSLPPGAVLPHPFLASQSLKFLHWDTLIPGAAIDDLASCIDAGAFPSLKIIRSPTDYTGKLQELCRPVAQIIHENDTSLLNLLQAFPANDTHYTRSLSEARRAAQDRLEQARNRPSLKIVVEEDGMIKHVYTMRAFMGSLQSNIEYCLEPDIEGSNDAVIGLADLIAAKGEEGGDSTVCTGPVNERETEDKRVWSHRPKRTGRSLELKHLF